MKIKAEPEQQGVELTIDNPVRALSHMVFADLKGVSEHIFLDNKWKILDVLKEAVRDHVKEKKKKKDTHHQPNTHIVLNINSVYIVYMKKLTFVIFLFFAASIQDRNCIEAKG